MSGSWLQLSQLMSMFVVGWVTGAVSIWRVCRRQK